MQYINVEGNISDSNLFPRVKKPLRVAAKIISYLAHPAILPVIMAVILLFIHPINVLLAPLDIRMRILLMVLLNTLFFPTFIVFLLWRLKFIKNMYLDDQKERIIPLVGSIIFYFWAFYVGRNIEYIPKTLQQWLFGVFLCSCMAMFLNIFLKISLHTIGIGGFIAFCFFLQSTDIYWNNTILLFALLVGGLVGTARLICEAHTPTQVYAGYVAGAACQLAAILIIK